MVRCSLLRLAGRRSALRQSAPARDFVVGISKVSERMRKERKHYSAEEKAAILRRHLLDEVPVSDLCEETACGRLCSTAGRRSFAKNGAAADNLGLRISPRNLIFVHSLDLFPFSQQRCESDTDQQSFR